MVDENGRLRGDVERVVTQVANDADDRRSGPGLIRPEMNPATHGLAAREEAQHRRFVEDRPLRSSRPVGVVEAGPTGAARGSPRNSRRDEDLPDFRRIRLVEMLAFDAIQLPTLTRVCSALAAPAASTPGAARDEQAGGEKRVRRQVSMHVNYSLSRCRSKLDAGTVSRLEHAAVRLRGLDPSPDHH